jgi:rubrerythrin
LDLSSYSEEEIFAYAIKAEIDANFIYSKLADAVKNAFLKDRLRFLANEEEKHRKFLEHRFKIWFLEKEPKLPTKTIAPLPKILIPDENVPLSEVIASAMKAELAAKLFYTYLAKRFDDDSNIQKTLLYFASMEAGHYLMLKMEKENLEKFEEYDTWPVLSTGIPAIY